MRNFIYLLFALIFIALVSNCRKEPETITETITITDTLIITDTLETFIPMDSGTVLFLVRQMYSFSLN